MGSGGLGRRSPRRIKGPVRGGIDRDAGRTTGAEALSAMDDTAPAVEATIFLAPVPAPAAAPAPASVAQPGRAPAQLPRTGLVGAGFVPLGLALGGLLMGAGFWSRRRR